MNGEFTYPNIDEKEFLVWRRAITVETDLSTTETIIFIELDLPIGYTFCNEFFETAWLAISLDYEGWWQMYATNNEFCNWFTLCSGEINLDVCDFTVLLIAHGIQIVE